MHARHTEKTLMPVKLHTTPMNLLQLQHASSSVSAMTFFADVFTCNCVRVTCYGWMMAKPYSNTITNWSIIFKTHESPCQRGRDDKSVEKVIIVHVFTFYCVVFQFHVTRLPFAISSKMKNLLWTVQTSVVLTDLRENKIYDFFFMLATKLFILKIILY